MIKLNQRPFTFLTTFLIVIIITVVCFNKYVIASNINNKNNHPSVKSIALELSQAPPFTQKINDSFLTRIGKPILDLIKRFLNRDLNLPYVRLGKWSFSIGDLLLIFVAIAILVLLVHMLHKFVIIRLLHNIKDIDLLEEKSITDFIQLYDIHKNKKEYNDALRFVFLALVKTIMTQGYQYTSNYQLFLYCKKLFPYHINELKRLINLFEGCRYGNVQCQEEDVAFAFSVYKKLSELYQQTVLTTNTVSGY